MSAEILFGSQSEQVAFTEQVTDRADAAPTESDHMTPLFVTSPLLGAAIGFTYTVSTAVHC